MTEFNARDASEIEKQRIDAESDIQKRKINAFSELGTSIIVASVIIFTALNIFRLWYDYAVDDQYIRALRACKDVPTTVYFVQVQDQNKTIEQEADQVKRQQLLLDAFAHCQEQVSAHYAGTDVPARKEK